MHKGANGRNGPIVVTLYKEADPRGQIDRILSKGKVFSNQFEGPSAGKYISDLMQLLREGQIYVNVYTKQNPDAEIPIFYFSKKVQNYRKLEVS